MAEWFMGNARHIGPGKICEWWAIETSFNSRCEERSPCKYVKDKYMTICLCKIVEIYSFN
jgi:hypothetical protein